MKYISLILIGTVVLMGCTRKSKYSYLTDKPLPVEVEVVGESSRMVEDTDALITYRTTLHKYNDYNK